MSLPFAWAGEFLTPFEDASTPKQRKCVPLLALEGDLSWQPFMEALRLEYDGRGSNDNDGSAKLCPHLVPPKVLYNVPSGVAGGFDMFVIFRKPDMEFSLLHTILMVQYRVDSSRPRDAVLVPPPTALELPYHVQRSGGGQHKDVLVVVAAPGARGEEEHYCSAWKRVHADGHASTASLPSNCLPAPVHCFSTPESERDLLMERLRMYQRQQLEQQRALVLFVACICKHLQLPEYAEQLLAHAQQLAGHASSSVLVAIESAANSVIWSVQRYDQLPEDSCKQWREAFLGELVHIPPLKALPLGLLAYACNYEALRAFPELSAMVDGLYEQWHNNVLKKYPGINAMKLPSVVLTVIAQAIVTVIVYWLLYVYQFRITPPHASPLPPCRQSADSSRGKRARNNASAMQKLGEHLDRLPLGLPKCDAAIATGYVRCSVAHCALLEVVTKHHRATSAG